MSDDQRHEFRRVVSPMATLLGTVLTAYSLRYLVYAPFVGTQSEGSPQIVVLAAVGILFGVLLLIAGLQDLDLLSSRFATNFNG